MSKATIKKFDAIIIGSGQGGTPLAKKLANAGWNTALIEKKFIGGTCINDGCTPTKTMIASARIAWLASQSDKLGVRIENVSIDLPAIVERKNEIVQSFRNGSRKSLETTENLSVIFGKASFVGPNRIAVTYNENNETEELEANYFFIDTGADATIPSIDGIHDVTYLTNTSILELKEIPEHLLIIGGAYVGLEFGQMFKRFGSKVTVLEGGASFLGKEDRDIAECMLNILQEEGLEILTATKANRISKKGEGLEVTIDKDGKEETIICSHILVAAGRTPQTADLHLSNAGIKTDDKGFIIVNDKLETSAKNIYAIGDVKGGPAFTHISYNDHLIIYKNLLQNGDKTIKDRMVPYCMFTDPQLGRIGMTETEALQAGKKIKVATLSMEKVARATETGETRGMLKAIVDSETKLILGAAIICEQGGEVMTILQMAMLGKIPYTTIRDMTIAHPLYAEALNNLFISLD